MRFLRRWGTMSTLSLHRTFPVNLLPSIEASITVCRLTIAAGTSMTFVHTKSMNTEEHIAAAVQVLQQLNKHHLRIKLSKCKFLQEQIPVLGDIVGRDGVQLDPAKSQIIRNWPEPKTKTIKVIFGNGGTQRWVLSTNAVQAPPQGLGKNNRLPDGTERVLKYYGRKMSDAERNYDVRETELLAIMHAMRTWRPYLIDKPFTCETDHQSLQSLLTQSTCSRRLARWLYELSEYPITLKWIPGNTNTTSDGLSQRPEFDEASPSPSKVSL